MNHFQIDFRKCLNFLLSFAGGSVLNGKIRYESIHANLFRGIAKEEAQKLADNSVDLIFTSPPYADRRKMSYGGIHPGRYVEWFLPISEQLLPVLKPDGTLVLNIK